jgi:TRAP-type transport system periplasmic protein
MRPIHLLAGAALAFGLLGTGAAQAQIELRFGHAQPPHSDTNMAGEVFKRLVEEGSNGEITVQVYPSSQLGNNNQMVEGVRLGTIDLTANGNPFYTAFLPEMNVLDLPFLFEDYDHVYRVIDGEIGRGLLDKLEDHRIKGLAFWEIGFRDLTNSRCAIRTPADMQGLKFRIAPNPAHLKAFELLGANPTPMPFSEVYMALQTGAIDGQENPVPLIYANRLNEVQEHLTLLGHSYTAQVFAMNLARFNSLAPEHQELLLDAAHQAALAQREDLARRSAEFLEELKSQGMQVVEDPDVEAFRAIVYEPVVADYVAEFGSDLVDRILALRDAD